MTADLSRVQRSFRVYGQYVKHECRAYAKPKELSHNRYHPLSQGSSRPPAVWWQCLKASIAETTTRNKPLFFICSSSPKAQLPCFYSHTIYSLFYPLFIYIQCIRLFCSFASSLITRRSLVQVQPPQPPKSTDFERNQCFFFCSFCPLSQGRQDLPRLQLKDERAALADCG